jgi:hypothetical protein
MKTEIRSPKKGRIPKSEFVGKDGSEFERAAPVFDKGALHCHLRPGSVREMISMRHSPSPYPLPHGEGDSPQRGKRFALKRKIVCHRYTRSAEGTRERRWGFFEFGLELRGSWEHRGLAGHCFRLA